MKHLLITITLIIFSTSAFATCYKDAENYGQGEIESLRAMECSDLVKSHSETLELISKKGDLKFYAFANMIFIESKGVIELMAGDQTRLTDVKSISYNEKNTMLIVLQTDSISMFPLNLIGNITPARHFKSNTLIGAKSAALTDNADELTVKFSDKVITINADAETRYRNQNKPVRISSSRLFAQ